MDKTFNWREYADSEMARIEAEISVIEQTENKAACPNHSGEATVDAFTKAAESIIDIFAEKTKNLR